MGDTLKREFSLDPVDTGRPSAAVDTGGGKFNPFGGGPLSSTPGSAASTPAVQTSQFRPSFLQSFIMNLGPALAGGLATSNGKGNFGTGLAGGLQGIQQHQQLQFERNIQLQNQSRLMALEQAQAAHLGAQTQQLQGLTPLEIQQKQLELQRMQGIISLSQDPTSLQPILASMSGSLGVLDKNEKAQLDAAKAEVTANLRQGKFDLTPYGAAVSKVSQDRIVTQRGAEASPFKAFREQFIKEHGREPNAKEVQDFSTAGATIRMQGLENLRQDNYLDTTAPGGNIEAFTAGEFAARNKAEPGRYVKFNGVVQSTLRAQSFVNDIRDGMAQMNDAIKALPPKGLSAGARALGALAMQNPSTAIETVISGAALQNISAQERDFLIAKITLGERALSLRSLQGQGGSGSDKQRDAILNMVPSFVTAADPATARGLMSTLKNNVDNLDRAIPNVGKSKTSAGNSGDGSLVDQLIRKHK